MPEGAAVVGKGGDDDVAVVRFWCFTYAEHCASLTPSSCSYTFHAVQNGVTQCLLNYPRDDAVKVRLSDSGVLKQEVQCARTPRCPSLSSWQELLRL